MSDREKVKQIICHELNVANIEALWDMNQIHVLPNSVIETSMSEGDLSKAIIEYYFPSVKHAVRQAHYTSLQKFQSIIESRTLRLYSLLKKINEQEFMSFSEDFELSGYLEKNDDKPYYEKLMTELFYTSFTKLEVSDKDYMWQVFGDGGNGVKLVFDIAVVRNRSELRYINYGNKVVVHNILKRLMERIYKECNRKFIMRGISRVGSFYLPAGYGLDKEEARLLIKSWGEGLAHDRIVDFGTSEAYIPLEIGVGSNPFCELKIIEVQVGANCDKNEVHRLLHKVGMSDIRVIDYV